MNNIRTTTAAALLMLLTLPPAASARLGESLAECATRYGPAVEFSEEKHLWLFRRDDLVVACSFDPPADAPTAPRTCTAITYRLQPAGSAIHQEIPPRLVAAFLKINGAGDWPDAQTAAQDGTAEQWWHQPGVGMAVLLGAPDFSLVIMLQRRLDMHQQHNDDALDEILRGL